MSSVVAVRPLRCLARYLKSLVFFWTRLVYFECVSVALVIQHAKRILHINQWSVRLYCIFLRCLINVTILWGKSGEREMCALTSCTTFVWHIFHSKKNSLKYCHKCIEVFVLKYLLFFSYFNKTQIFSSDFRNILQSGANLGLGRLGSCLGRQIWRSGF